MSDPDKTKKIEPIKRTKTPEQIAASELELLRIRLRDIEVIRANLNSYGVAV